MNPLAWVRYAIGGNVNEVPDRVTMYGYGAVRSPSAKYINLYSEDGEVPEYGPYLPRTRTASQYEEGVPDPSGMGFWRNLDDQIYRAVTGKAKYVETDNRDAYLNSVVLKVFDTVAAKGLQVICKNPGMSDHDEDSTELLRHSAVVSSIIEKGDVTAGEYHLMRTDAGKPELPVTFVAFGDGREWALKIAAEIRTHGYVNMGVTYDRAANEYGGEIEDILKPLPSIFEPGVVLPNIGNNMAWRLARSLETLRDQVNAQWRNRDKSSDGTIGDAAHAAGNSDHNPNSANVVTAMDITNDPANGLVARALAETLVASRDPRIKYIISNAQIISSLVQPWVWRSYNGSNAHLAHVHISVMAEPLLYDDMRPWKLAATVAPARASSVNRFTDIVATEFGGRGNPNNSAYDEHFIDDDEFGVALPFRFRGERPSVRVFKDGKSVVCEIVDVGPWNINDPYWETGGRPQAETGIDNTGRRTNKAGIDLTPLAARTIGLNGLGKVDWEFVGNEPVIIQHPKPPGNPMPQTPVPFNAQAEDFLNEIRPIAERYVKGSDSAPADALTAYLVSRGWVPPMVALPKPIITQPDTPAPAGTAAPGGVSVPGVAGGLTLSGILAGLMGEGTIGTPFGMGKDPSIWGTISTVAALVAPFIGGAGAGGGILNAGSKILGMLGFERKKTT